MESIHPGGLTLERYRNHSLKPEEAAKVKGHLDLCVTCSRKLEDLQSLDRQLSMLPMEEPSPDFTDRVLGKLQPLESPFWDNKQPSPAERTSNANRSRLFRPELANALIATAATYLFISAGIVQSVFAMDPAVVEYGLHAKLLFLMDWVGRLSQSLPS